MWAPFCSVYAPVSESNDKIISVTRDNQDEYQTNNSLKYDLELSEEK